MQRRKTVKNGNRSNQQKQLCTCSTLFLCYNVKLPETSQLHVLWRNCRTCSRSLFFHCRSLSPCIGGGQHFSFCHRRYKILMLFFQQKMSPSVFYDSFISRSKSLSPFLSLSFAGLPPTFSFSLSFSCSIFQICGHDNLSKLNTLDNTDTETISAFRFRLY